MERNERKKKSNQNNNEVFSDWEALKKLFKSSKSLRQNDFAYILEKKINCTSEAKDYFLKKLAKNNRVHISDFYKLIKDFFPIFTKNSINCGYTLTEVLK